MLKLPFEGNYRLTQPFGNGHFNKDAFGSIINPYARFGMSGHNGLDYATPTGTKIFAPHSGKILEVADQGNDGYGRYIKIENDEEGSVLAHLQEARVKVGDFVDQGKLVALSDNTGNSTGSHLHWGYYKKPRNRQNGYAGFIDQLPMIGGGNMANIYKGLDLNNSDSMKVAVDIWDAVVNKNEYLKKSEAVTRIEYDQLNRQLVECRNKPSGDPEATKKLEQIKVAFNTLHSLLK